MLSSADAVAGVRPRVLVVEDHADVAAAVERAVSGWGFDAWIALDGYSAISIARENPPHAVLLDLALPGMDGFEVAEKLRAQGVDAPLVVLTAFDDVRLRTKALELGVKAYLSKPVDWERLRGLLSALLLRGAADDPPS